MGPLKPFPIPFLWALHCQGITTTVTIIVTVMAQNEHPLIFRLVAPLSSRTSPVSLSLGRSSTDPSWSLVLPNGTPRARCDREWFDKDTSLHLPLCYALRVRDISPGSKAVWLAQRETGLARCGYDACMNRYADRPTISSDYQSLKTTSPSQMATDLQAALLFVDHGCNCCP
ncbi:hypothetical protein B0T10DRAFT_460557 [Thelonectria olida]|uniref:Uncharacterized protein n=1 Tax=Thelonectria olida TaxID=1576542 RepID=A0A9P9AKW3_9HYPO|nr:hypothetical protein B0T10DRAFT_460557 [Thelonectria olida]